MKKESGFVLADALVALLVCSLFLASLLQLDTNSRRRVSQSHDRLVAAFVARAVLEDPSLRDEQGEVLIDGKAFQWSRTRTDRPTAETDRVSLSDLRVTISWPSPTGDTQSISANTVRLRSIDHEG